MAGKKINFANEGGPSSDSNVFSNRYAWIKRKRMEPTLEAKKPTYYVKNPA
jgi:hypothetical protein